LSRHRALPIAREGDLGGAHGGRANLKNVLTAAWCTAARDCASAWRKIMKQLGLGIIVAIGLTLPAFGQGVDPILGTWKLNLEKSTTNFPLPKTVNFTVVKDGEHMTSTVETITAQGQTVKFVIPHIYDGMPHSVTGNANFDAVAFTRIGNTLNQVRFKQGKAIEIGQVAITEKTFTSTAEGIAPDGFSYHYVYVWDKQ
jgi:hypothetical protein